MPSAVEIEPAEQPANSGKTLDAFHTLVQDVNKILGPSSGLTSADVDPKNLQDLMRNYSSNEEEWKRYAMSDAGRTFTRNLVDRGNGKSNLVGEWKRMWKSSEIKLELMIHSWSWCGHPVKQAQSMIMPILIVSWRYIEKTHPQRGEQRLIVRSDSSRFSERDPLHLARSQCCQQRKAVTLVHSKRDRIYPRTGDVHVRWCTYNFQTHFYWFVANHSQQSLDCTNSEILTRRISLCPYTVSRQPKIIAHHKQLIEFSVHATERSESRLLHVQSAHRGFKPYDILSFLFRDGPENVGQTRSTKLGAGVGFCVQLDNGAMLCTPTRCWKE